jgi:hypothetical protein
MSAPFFAGRIFLVDETSDVQSESVGHAGGDAIMISQCRRSEPLDFFGLNELLAGCERGTILPKTMEFAIKKRQRP